MYWGAKLGNSAKQNRQDNHYFVIILGRPPLYTAEAFFPGQFSGNQHSTVQQIALHLHNLFFYGIHTI